MKDLKYYNELPYTVIVQRDDEGDYVARVDELPGCAAHGKTASDAFDSVNEAKELWILDCLESGHAVPEPSADLPLSGKWVQRVPKSLHRKLVTLAKKEGVSLNQLVTSILAEAAGSRLGVVTSPVGVFAVRHWWTDPEPSSWVIDHSILPDATNSRIRDTLKLLACGIPNHLTDKQGGDSYVEKKRTHAVR